MYLTEGFVSLGLYSLSKGVPLLPLYMRGAGLHEGALVGYGIGVLVGYNCASCMQCRLDSTPIRWKLHEVLRGK